MYTLQSWSPYSQCVVTYQLVLSVFKHTDNACAPSMMDDRTAKYSNFTLDDNLLNLMGEMKNAVPLILNPFHLKGKMLCCIGHLNWTVLQLQQKLGFKGPDIKICKNVVMDYFNAPSLDLTWGKEGHLQVGRHIWTRQDQKMKYHSCWMFMTFHQFIALEFNYVLGFGFIWYAYINQTPGNYPKGNILYSVHGESLKSRIHHLYGEDTARHIRLFDGIYKPDAGELP